MRPKFFVLHTRSLLIVGAISGIALIILAITVSSTQCNWTGLGRCVETAPKDTQVYRAKTLWDWLQLLIVPVFLAIAAAFLARLEKAKEERLSENRAKLQHGLAQDRQCEDALQHYFDRITDLLISGNLKIAPVNPEPGSESERIIRVNLAARGRTLALLRRLDGARKGQVISFLEELHLIQDDNLVIPLTGADLQDAQLASQHLAKVNMSYVNLTNGNLQNAYLAEASFTKSKMQCVNLSDANLRDAKLVSTDLSMANLDDAILKSCSAPDAKFVTASLNRTNFVQATLDGVDFAGSILSDTKFEGANLRDAKFQRAQLSNVKFSHCNIASADFSEAILTNSSFEDCVGVAKMPYNTHAR